MLSLNARLIVSASVVLAAFLGLAGVALDRAFRESALARVNDRLQSRIYALIAAAEPDEGALKLPEALPEPRLSVPQSGVYAQLVDESGRVLWHSRSALGIDIDYPRAKEPGVAVFSTTRDTQGAALFALAFGLKWAFPDGQDKEFTLQAAEARAPFEAEIARFRGTLWLWLAGAGLVLLAVQGAVLRWSLAPLRKLARDVADIEAGRKHELEGSYPKELARLTQNLNLLVVHSRRQLERYRNALGDLAHSLKTPLAVLRNEVEALQESSTPRATLTEQVERMDRTIHYQLQRAAASGRTALTPSVGVAKVVDRIRSTLLKVYADKQLQIDVTMDKNLSFKGDEGDLTEILGNLLDNACKWGRGKVRLEGSRSGQRLEIAVEDDGPGLPNTELETFRARGARGDVSVPGQGIGLAIVDELVTEVYGGILEAGESTLGGARFKIVLEDEKE
ncbi:MAG: ATP-binding protein [Gammaproteobacteria bacterium]|nr:ATP-binding protein [Gammaproteobacteria bacterium]MDH3411488.1 ATP-binding protein [Gammaproteobacteria bacterium]